MRIECPKCNELVEVDRFTCTQGPDRVRFECPACEEEVTVTSSGSDDVAQEEEDPVPVAEDTPAPVLDSNGSVTDVVLEQLWDLVTDEFAEGSRHDAFIAACEAQNKLAFAAARYQEWLADHPEDAVVQKRQKQLLALAQVHALAVSSRESKEKDPLRKALTAFLVMVMLLALVIVAAPILLRGCRATQPGQSQLRRPSLPMVSNLRRRGKSRQGYRGLTPRRHRHRRRGSQLRNLKPPPRPRSGRPAPMRPGPMRRPAPMRPAPMRPASAPPGGMDQGM